MNIYLVLLVLMLILQHTPIQIITYSHGNPPDNKIYNGIGYKPQLMDIKENPCSGKKRYS